MVGHVQGSITEGLLKEIWTFCVQFLRLEPKHMLPCPRTLAVYFCYLSYLRSLPGYLTDLGGGERLQSSMGKAAWVCWISALAFAGAEDAWYSQVFHRARQGQRGQGERPGELVQSSAFTTTSRRDQARPMILHRGLCQEVFAAFPTDKSNQKAASPSSLDCYGEETIPESNPNLFSSIPALNS